MSHLKAAAIVLILCVLLLTAFTSTQQENAFARANLTTYQTVPPITWNPMGYTENGTAVKLDVQTVGVVATQIQGNVGIGDGSVRALNVTSNPNTAYTGAYLIAADVSMEPLDPSRMRGYGQGTGESNASNFTSAQNNTSVSNNTIKSMLPLPEIDQQHFDNTIPGNNDNTRAPEANNTGDQNAADTGQIGTGSGTMALNDPYHWILMGRPVDDLLYEEPHAIVATTYARLVGFRLPGGDCVNIGTRCLSYGY